MPLNKHWNQKRWTKGGRYLLIDTKTAGVLDPLVCLLYPTAISAGHLCSLNCAKPLRTMFLQ
eukprot:3249730-Amphidinium_carterae.1